MNERAVLFGCSRVGKSMILQLIAGLMAPDEGVVRLHGRMHYEASFVRNVPPQAYLRIRVPGSCVVPHRTAMGNVLYDGHTASIRLSRDSGLKK